MIPITLIKLALKAKVLMLKIKLKIGVLVWQVEGLLVLSTNNNLALCNRLEM